VSYREVKELVSVQFCGDGAADSSDYYYYLITEEFREEFEEAICCSGV
jgi:hypothetical protein